MDSDKKEEKKDDKKEEKTEQSKKDSKTPEFIYAPLEILKIISIAQNMNGLRHKDYQRYQTYCTRKISKIRQTYKMQQGIGKKFTATGRVNRLGGRIASVQMTLENETGLLIATGGASYVIS